jgi:lysophospholipase L1-like esterase
MTSAPAAMPVVSRGIPSFTNDDFSGAFPASLANNVSYGDYWRCLTAPVGNTDSGTLTAPVYLAYDLSGVPAAQRGAICLAWYNDASTGAYNPSLISNNYYNVPAGYTIDANAAAGGTLPGSGWVTLATVAGNAYHSRQHALNMTGYNWIRINVTAINGSISNNNVQINMDVHDCSGGNLDNYIFYGDSITQRGLDHSNLNLGSAGTLPYLIQAGAAAHFPVCECGGIGGYLSTDGAANIGTWLPLFSGQYVGLLYGTNDANNAAAGDPTFGPNFTAKMTQMLNAVLAAGKIPIMPRTIPWGKTTNIQANGPEINTRLTALFASYQTAIAGPDLWAYFSANPNLINAVDVHPTDPDGYAAYRQQWANALITNIYTNSRRLVIQRRRFFL